MMSKEIHILKPLTFPEIIKLLEDNDDLKKITCSKSVFNRISNEYLDAFDQLGLEVEIKKKSGAKKKYSEVEPEIVKLATSGKKPKEIGEILNIKTKTVYYILSKNRDKIKLNNYKRKYDLNERKEIILLNNEGYSAKEISSMKNIPLRSVYYILNDK